MPRFGTTGKIAAIWCTTIADPKAPTVVELTAGVKLAGFMTRDGLKTPSSGNTIEAGDAGSRFNKTAPGTYGGDAGEFTAHRDSLGTADLAWTTMARDSIGFMVIARMGFHQSVTTGLGTSDGTPTVGDRCEVYPSTVISRAPSDIAENETAKFTSQLAFTGEPEQDAVVAAGA